MKGMVLGAGYQMLGYRCNAPGKGYWCKVLGAGWQVQGTMCMEPVTCMKYCTYFACLDLGANIGMFTVVVASMGRKVKAVDAGFTNHAYIRYTHSLYT